MGYEAGVTFPQFCPLYDRVPHLAGAVAAKLLSEANKNDLLCADNSTNSLTIYFSSVCAFSVRMDIRPIIYLIHR